MTGFRAPVATYRVQFNKAFGFQHARELVPYLSMLGISDLYASPVMKARSGSQHGYDIVDASELNPELGTEVDFNLLCDELQRHGMGLLVDIVPNHMAASSENRWWTDVLECGPDSEFADYFDIEWLPVAVQGTLANRVLLPVLGKPYGEVLESGELRAGYDPQGFFVEYFDRKLPLATHSYADVLATCSDVLQAPGEHSLLRETIQGLVADVSRLYPRDLTAKNDRTSSSGMLKEAIRQLHEADGQFRECLESSLRDLNGDKDNPRSFDRMDSLLEKQWYRLSYWRMASEQINYRRFFDITDLVGLRIENPAVFEARNMRLSQLVAENKVTGVRIDHIDGLHDPADYLNKLQSLLAGPSEESDPRFYCVVEKILAREESLPPDFTTNGTTGYDFLNVVNGIFVDPNGLASIDRVYRRLTGEARTFDQICYERKKQVIEQLFSGEIRALGTRLVQLAALDRNARDFSPSELLQGLVEIIASFPVYRTYIRTFEVDEHDRRTIEAAVETARTRVGSRVDEPVFSFIRRVLLVDPPHYLPDRRDDYLRFVLRLQQFTGRVTAKGVEDTAFYAYNRLISLNEVGGEPGHDFSDSVARFHGQNQKQRETWRYGINATSTHDTKRSEDARARINVLSELPRAFERAVSRWSTTNSRVKMTYSGRPVPDANEEQLIYQTLIGIWPLFIEDHPAIPNRMSGFVVKAVREAKTHSSWLQQNDEYENALVTFVERILEPGNTAFLEDFSRFHKQIAEFGFLNSLGQILMKIVAPGVPDFYQGTELWDFSLVDPDNRRLVQFEKRKSLLDQLQSFQGDRRPLVRDLLAGWKDGAIKMYVIERALKFRQANRDLLLEGDYTPLLATGKFADSVCAFSRSQNGKVMLVITPRFCSRLVKAGDLPLGSRTWGRTLLSLHPGAPTRWSNVFSGETLTASSGLRKAPSIKLAEALASFPVALLESV